LLENDFNVLLKEQDIKKFSRRTLVFEGNLTEITK